MKDFTAVVVKSSADPCLREILGSLAANQFRFKFAIFQVLTLWEAMSVTIKLLPKEKLLGIVLPLNGLDHEHAQSYLCQITDV